MEKIKKVAEAIIEVFLSIPVIPVMVKLVKK